MPLVTGLYGLQTAECVCMCVWGRRGKERPAGSAEPLRQKLDSLNSMNHPLGFSLTFYSFNLPLAEPSHCSPLRLQQYIFPACILTLPTWQHLLTALPLCRSLPLYLHLHTTLPASPSSISRFINISSPPPPAINHQPPPPYLSFSLNHHSISSCSVICFPPVLSS